ncbi:MAG TPA: glycerol kinase GlpK [Longimicrobiales bacterium]|nr:glycerol kinase GlpK [Longimicrobiales bacterium]
MAAILAIDEGTTGSTCLVIDEAGHVRGRAYSEFTQHFPRPGWVEHDAAEIWDVTLAMAREAVSSAGLEASDIAGIGITNQRETVVVWDRATGQPVHRAIVWQDRRTSDRCRALREAGREDDIRARTGLVIDPYFSGTKLEWLLEHVDGLRERAEAGELAAGTMDAWLIWKLTGGRVHATEPTNASRTLLYNIDRLDWDDELLSLFGVPRALLPDVRSSSGVFGMADASLLGAEIPVAGAAGDQQAALFGQRCWEKGRAKNTYGTGAFLLLHTGGERVASEHGLLTTVACDPQGQPAYALEGSIFVAGAAIQWLRDELKVIERADETAALAASVDSNDGVYFVPAFVGLGAPHWLAEARGTIVGLTRGTGRAHLVRAALEAMAYSTRDVLEAMVADSGVAAEDLAVDGGAAANDWLMQFQADVLALPVKRPQLLETTALGAAGLAGLATGVWPDADAFGASRPEPDRFRPRMDADTRKTLVAGWRRAVAAAKAWAEEEHA